MIRTTPMPSGLRVVTEAMPDVRSVTAGFWVATGSRDEDASVSGASHFLEHLLFKGTASRSARDIAEAVDAVGGDLNAFTTKEYTAFYVRVLADALDLGLDILCDIITAPAFRPDEFEAERQVILEEILLREDEPADLVHEVLSDALFPGHPLGWEVLGREETVKAMDVATVRDFFARHYRPANMVFAAAGDLDHDRVLAGLGERLGEAAGGSPPTRVPPSVPPRRVAVARRQTEQAHVALGLLAPDRHSPERWAMGVLNHTLGGGLSSRLFQEIRERRGLAYSVYSYRTAYDDAGALVVYAGTGPERAVQVVDLVGTELERLARDGLTPRELDVARGHLRGDLALSLEDSAARMSRIGRSVLLHGEVLPVEEVAARIGSVTLEQVSEVAARVLGGARTLAVVGPFDESDFG